MPKPSIIIIVGPNASGKSELAVRLAKKLSAFGGGEIISADSRQVYRGLDIGTGKIAGKWIIGGNREHANRKRIYKYKGVPHHCIDFASPQKIFTAAEYKKCAEKAIYDIANRKKLPILVGGTGFWIDAVAYDLKLPAVPPDPELRKRLEKKTAPELLEILRKLDPERAKTVEPQNPRRLIRAIEIAITLGRVPLLKKRSPYRLLWIGVKPTSEKLKQLIRRRLLKRLRSGMVQEAKRLKAQGLSWKRFYELGLEYRFLADYLRRKINKQEMVEQLERAILDYARRQMVWFKRNPQIRWLDSSKEAEKLAFKFLSRQKIKKLGNPFGQKS